MQGSLENPPIVIRGKRWRGAYMLVLALLIGLSALGVLNTGRFDVAMLIPAIAGLFLGAMGLWMVLMPATLIVGRNGIKQTVLWRTRSYSWSQAYDFRPVMVGLYTKMVGFDFLGDVPKGGRARGLNRALTGAQGALQAGWELAPDKLANLLNHAREQWLAEAAAPEGAPRPVVAPPPVARGFYGARMNRKVYWIATGAIFAIALALNFLLTSSGGSGRIGGFTVLIWIYTARLHDAGRSGWWQLVCYGIQAVVVVAAIAFLGVSPKARWRWGCSPC